MNFHETIDQAEDLSVLAPGTPLLETGTIGNGPAGAADVNFYHFNLAQAASVTLDAGDPLSSDTLGYVLSLYDTDQQDPLGNHLIDQADGATNAGDASITIALAPGDYYAAVSGSGNRYFNPHLADSGYNGNTGDYQLSLASTALNSNPGDGPVVLRFDPNETTYLPAGPLVLRASLSAPIDPTTLQQDMDVQLYYDPTDPFTSSSGTQLSLGSVNYDSSSLEVQAIPSAPLAPGYYRLTLLGNTDLNAQVIESPDGTPLGDINGVNDGQDFSTTFYVAGILGNISANPGPDDTVATARELGNVTNTGLVQVQGVIGDNPNDPTPFNPASVEFYHFEVTGSGNYAFGAEVFANRIGSQLGASVQLYRENPDGSLQEVADNDGSLNATLADNGSVPLFSDPVVYASVTPGDYYLAVTSQFTTYDPETSLSAQGGFTSGPYVLNLRVDPATTPPHVVSTSIADASTMTSPPPTFTVQFDEPMNLQQLAFQAYLHNGNDGVSSVTVQADDGTQYFPRLLSYDPATNTATFLLINALPNGTYTLHLSGPNGLTDLGGNPLVGNDATSGDYLVHFTINAPPRGTPGDPTTWLDQEPNDDVQDPQQIGTLFPLELENTVTISRPAGGGATDNADYYEITVLQTQEYLFALSNVTNLPADVLPTIWADGVQQATIPQGGSAVEADLSPGTYVIGVDWSSEPTTGVGYDLQISILGSLEPATSLTTGPAPALRLRLATDTPPQSPTPPSTGSSGNTPSSPPSGTNTPPTIPQSPSDPTPSSPTPPSAPQSDNPPTGVAPVGVTTSPPAAAPTPIIPAGPSTTTAPVANINVTAPDTNARAGTNQAANAFIPSNIVLALTDRALGSPADPNSGARAFLRESPNGTAPTAVASGSGPSVLATLATLVVNTITSGEDVQNPSPLETGAADRSAFQRTVGAGIAQLEAKLVHSAFDAAHDLPSYSETLVNLFSSWQFGYRAEKPSDHSYPPTLDASALPPLNIVLDEPTGTLSGAAPEAGATPWYHLGNLKYATIAALSVTLAALRFQSWRSKRRVPKPTP